MHVDCWFIFHLYCMERYASLFSALSITIETESKHRLIATYSFVSVYVPLISPSCCVNLLFLLFLLKMTMIDGDYDDTMFCIWRLIGCRCCNICVVMTSLFVVIDDDNNVWIVQCMFIAHIDGICFCHSLTKTIHMGGCSIKWRH